jgi:hypothetical protein
MCRLPVTLGGGLTMVKGCASGRSGRNRPFASQWAYHFASIAAGSKVLSSAVSVMGRRLCQRGARALIGGKPRFNRRLAEARNFPASPAAMRDRADFTIETDAEGRTVLALTGNLLVSTNRLPRSAAARAGSADRADRPCGCRRDRHGRRLDRLAAGARSRRNHSPGRSEMAARLISARCKGRGRGDIAPARHPVLRRVPEAVGAYVSALPAS